MANKKTMFIFMIIMFVVMIAKEPLKSAGFSATDAKNEHNDETENEQDRIKKVLHELATEMELSCGKRQAEAERPREAKRPRCPTPWVRHGDACYYIDDTPTQKWTDAREKCQNMTADLPIIKSSAENTIIRDLVKKKDTVTREGVWLGMQRKNKTSKSDFYWIDNSRVGNGTYENWALHEPNMSGENEHCANMYVKYVTGYNNNAQPGQWNDLRCNCTNYHGGGKECPVILCQKRL